MNIAICDDDVNQSIDVKNKCEHSLCILKMVSPITIHTYYCGEDLIRALKTRPRLKYDIFVMDIEFGSNAMNGLETTRTLRKMGIIAPVIITTSHDTYLRQGYGLDIMRYIDKPVTQEDITEALNACIKRITLLEGKEIILKKNEIENVAVKFKDIIYFESFSHMITAHTKDQNVYSRIRTIEFVEEQAPPYFMKINKGILVNLNYVSCIKEFDLTLDNGVVLPIAQRRKRQCLEFFNAYVKENM